MGNYQGVAAPVHNGRNNRYTTHTTTAGEGGGANLPLPSGVTFSTSVVVLPSTDETFAAFLKIKSLHHNPRILRPPFPHLTLLSPFVERDKHQEAAQQIRAAIEVHNQSSTQQITAFDLTFSRLLLFHNRKSSTLYAVPDSEVELQRIYGFLDTLFPLCRQVRQRTEKGIFSPHIGIGFFTDRVSAEHHLAQYEATWQPITFRVASLHVLYHSEADPASPFEVSLEIPLPPAPVA